MRKKDYATIIAIIVAVLSCIGTWIAVPQIQGCIWGSPTSAVPSLVLEQTSMVPEYTSSIPSATPTVPKISPPPCQDTGETWFRSTDRMTMVCVPAGEFIMGSTDTELDAFLNECPNCQQKWFADEVPHHTVYLDAFWIDQTEVSNAQYQQCVEGRACEQSAYGDNVDFGAPDQPVAGVDWDNAMMYCMKIGGRLPTEAEWEKAARGVDRHKYPWGDEWNASRCNSFESGIGKTVPVGSYPDGASPYGVLDMAGNVWEWVVDWYESDYYTHSPLRNPRGPETGSNRVIRGGAWSLLHPRDVRCAHRASAVPAYHQPDVGFRCVIPSPYD